ncbi:MAG TPA: hypothetical protein VFF00_08440 [Candidatus Elarobacter sp.]|nr:hypothetical protein [Candidatus Elarobacter sp.]
MTEEKAKQLRKRIEGLVESGFKIRNASNAEDFETLGSGFGIRVADASEKSASALEQEYMINLRFQYEDWFSQARLLVSQLLPERVEDFLFMYQRKRTANWAFDAYTINDFLTGVGYASYKSTTLRHRFHNLFENQLGILRSALTRIEPRLNDLYAEVAGNVYENMLGNAKMLLDAGFLRPAAAVAGVVTESYLHDICDKHRCMPAKKNPTISAYNDALKQASLIDQPTWRLIARIADIRNIAVHRTGAEASQHDVTDIIRDAGRILSAVF